MISDDAFWDVPIQLKETIGRLINVPADEVILGNSTSYGLYLLAQGLPWKPEDEVLLVEGDFPASVVPWLPLEKRGVQIRFLRPATAVPTPEEVERAITPSTRVFCSSWVFSFRGHAIDIDPIGEVCRAHRVLFVLNGSQAIGTRPIDARAAKIGALVCCGFKWLCGPYATGFSFMRPEVLDSLTFEPAYWLTQISKDELGKESNYRLRPVRDAASYDVFGTANFFNFMPLAASIGTLLGVGIDEIARYNDALVDRLVSGLDDERFDLVSPVSGQQRSTLVLIQPRDRSKSRVVHETLAANGVDVALRGDKIRFSPHVYNTEDDIDRALAVLDQAGR